MWEGYFFVLNILILIGIYFRHMNIYTYIYEPARHGPVHAAFFYDMSNRVEHQKLNQEAAEIEFLVFNPDFGKHRH